MGKFVEFSMRTRRRGPATRALWCVLGTFFFGALAHATSVTPPSFTQLVAESDTIIRGSVQSVSSAWVDGPQGHLIKTFVTFHVEKRLKGDVPDTLTLDFLGGTVGIDTLRVPGMPQFEVGATEVVFIHGNGVQFCPLVRMMHGRYRAQTDAPSRRRFVARDDGSPLATVDDVQLPMENRGLLRAFRNPANAMSPESFETEIASEVSRQTP
jgi:hypothetical protein